jgi:hypothetical protein
MNCAAERAVAGLEQPVGDKAPSYFESNTRRTPGPAPRPGARFGRSGSTSRRIGPTRLQGLAGRMDVPPEPLKSTMLRIPKPRPLANRPDTKSATTAHSPRLQQDRHACRAGFATGAARRRGTLGSIVSIQVRSGPHLGRKGRDFVPVWPSGSAFGRHILRSLGETSRSRRDAMHLERTVCASRNQTAMPR